MTQRRVSCVVQKRQLGLLLTRSTSPERMSVEFKDTSDQYLTIVASSTRSTAERWRAPFVRAAMEMDMFSSFGFEAASCKRRGYLFLCLFPVTATEIRARNLNTCGFSSRTPIVSIGVCAFSHTTLSKLPTLSVPEDLFSQSLRTTRGPHSIHRQTEHTSRAVHSAENVENTHKSNTHRNISHKRAVECRASKELHPLTETNSVPWAQQPHENLARHQPISSRSLIVPTAAFLHHSFKHA